MSAGLDWQFVIVTLAAVWGGWVLLRPLWRWRSEKKATGACGRCSSADCKGETVPGAPPASPKLVQLGSGALRKQNRPEGLQPRGRA